MTSDEASAEITRFIAEHRRALVRLAVGICRDANGAEDLVQDTSVALVRHWQKVRYADFTFAYVRQIMVRTYLNQARTREAPVLNAVTVEQRAPDALGELESIDAAMSMLQALSPQARTVIALRYLDDLDDATIAQILGISRSTVRVTAHRALKQLSITPGPSRLRRTRRQN